MTRRSFSGGVRPRPKKEAPVASPPPPSPRKKENVPFFLGLRRPLKAWKLQSHWKTQRLFYVNCVFSAVFYLTLSKRQFSPMAIPGHSEKIPGLLTHDPPITIRMFKPLRYGGLVEAGPRFDSVFRRWPFQNNCLFFWVGGSRCGC